MGIFGAIKDAIFGPTHATRIPQATAEAPAPGVAATAGASPQGGGWMPTPDLGSLQPVDVDAVLRQKLAAKGNPDLNYQSSIVDLMKLLDLDSSLSARGELAEELGYTGAKDGSAEMNIWLHRKVIEELERNGGTVPDSMKS